MVTLFYILYAITTGVDKAGFFGGRTMQTVLTLGVYIIGIFSVIFIFYTNSFLFKRRKNELGLYSVLGMEKKHISRVLCLEAIYSGGISLILGILFGMLFSKLMYAFLLMMLHIDTSIKLNFSFTPVIATVILFGAIFVFIILFNIIKIMRINPIDLIKGGKKGEREPRSNWIIGLIGLISLGFGYYIALSIKNPITAMTVFFLAVILVAIGTYFIFTSGSIMLLKILRKNKKFYYKKNNFISVSNMIYRMKQNAVGLANIAILSTAVLLVLSTTVSLYVGIEDVISTRYKRDIITNYIYEGQDLEELERVIQNHAKDNNVVVKDSLKFFNSSFLAQIKDNKLLINDDFASELFEDYCEINLFLLEDYNKEHNSTLQLSKNEVFIHSDSVKFNYPNLVILGKEYAIKGHLEEMKFSSDWVFNKMDVVVRDIETINSAIFMVNGNNENGGGHSLYYEYDFNLTGEVENKTMFASTLRDALNKSITRVAVVDDIYTSRQDIMSMYGSLFFIGMFLGTLFMVATVLIIYYKQISEGYEDRKRFEILQKVGMSKKEVKETIKSQILIIFFLPLITAIIHIMVAFPLVNRILILLNLNNSKLFLLFTGIVILVFGLAYGIVYRWTARIYYKIVN